MAESSEIQLAIKIGRVVIDKERDTLESVRMREVLSKLDINLDRLPTFDSHMSKDLRELVSHWGDSSLISHVQEHYLSENKYDLRRLAQFIVGIGYLYPPTSLQQSIFRYWNEHLGTKFVFMSDAHTWAVKLYKSTFEDE